MLARLALALVVLSASFAIATTTAGGVAGSASVRAKAVAWAEQQVGTREAGSSNCSPKIDRWQRDMGLKVPPCRVWCGAFVHQAFRHAGVQLSARLIDPDRAYRDALAGRRGLRSIPIGTVTRGDLVFYKLREGVLASHLGIARRRPKGTQLDTVEGNTSNAVRLERRGTKFVVLAARVTGDA